MKVIEHGEVLEFTCTGCGCIYAAGRKEVRDAGFYLHVECPECGTDNKYDGGENESKERSTLEFHQFGTLVGHYDSKIARAGVGMQLKDLMCPGCGETGGVIETGEELNDED